MFVTGRIYNRRRELHKVYGGQRQGGIATPAKYPYVFLFTGSSGTSFGYHDEFRPDGTFWYTGEGQIGDMQMMRGNLAIRDHAKRGRELHLFEEVDSGSVRYVGQAVYLGHHSEERPDVKSNPRKAIVFELAISPRESGEAISSVAGAKTADRNLRLWSRPLAQVRELALTGARAASTPSERRAIVYQRSEAIRVYVLRRAAGICEACGSEAPFVTGNGKKYLEPHHIHRMADGGPDDPHFVAAVCPNCHRAVHYVGDRDSRNARLAQVVTLKEAASNPSET